MPMTVARPGPGRATISMSQVTTSFLSCGEMSEEGRCGRRKKKKNSSLTQTKTLKRRRRLRSGVGCNLDCVAERAECGVDLVAERLAGDE